MQSLTQPSILLKPFAEDGQRNSIPLENTDTSNPQLADLTNGFPAITSEDPDDGGLPPERKDFNGLGHLTTTYDYFYQAGGTFTYNATIATAIGGYPLGARLWYTDTNGNTVILRSTKANNSDNFITTPSYIGTSWVADTPSLSWNNAWTGTNTFVTPAANDDSQKAATTEWCRDNMVGVPNYSARVSVTSPYTPTQNGILRVRDSGSYPMAEIRTTDDFIIARAVSADNTSDQQVVWAIVKAGETYIMNAHSGRTPICFFVPFE